MALADVGVAEARAGGEHGRGEVALLDVHVVRVEVHDDVVAADLLDELHALLRPC